MVTIVTTPLNAARFESSLNRVIDELDLLIELVKLRFPCVEAGLRMAVRPMCIISDFCLPYTNNVAKKFNIPRITFTGFSCFCLVCMHCVKLHGDEIDRSVGSDHEYFVLPGLPDHNKMDKLQRGSNTISLSNHSLDWLDTKEPKSVIYVCFGSILGLEASETPFIWVIRETEATKDLYRWIMDDGFEDRVAARGIVIRGWAPQVSILSHRSGIAAGIPLVTWPLFGDQFSNEKLIVEVAKVGVRVGAERPTFWDGKEETNVSIKRGDVERAVRLAMDRGNERRKRATKLAEMARKAVESDGSSYRNVSMFIEDIVKHQEGRRKK
ncbi:UDP-glycosyltransferase 73C25 [Linum perenne]